MKIARKYGLWLFSDEVYRGLEREAERIPAVCDLYERGVSLGGLSKAYGLAGLRIGWIATPDATLYEKMAAFKDYLSICNSAPERVSRRARACQPGIPPGARAEDRRAQLGLPR